MRIPQPLRDCHRGPLPKWGFGDRRPRRTSTAITAYEIDPGTYDMRISTTGYNPKAGFRDGHFRQGRANRLDKNLSPGIELVTVEVKYERPVIEQDDAQQGSNLTSEQIKQLPTRDVKGLASFTAGVASADEGADINVRIPLRCHRLFHRSCGHRATFLKTGH